MNDINEVHSSRLHPEIAVTLEDSSHELLEESKTVNESYVSIKRKYKRSTFSHSSSFYKRAK